MNIDCSSLSLSIIRNATQSKVKFGSSQSNVNLDFLSPSEFQSQAAKLPGFQPNESYVRSNHYDLQISTKITENQTLGSEIDKGCNYGLINYPNGQYQYSGSCQNYFTSLEFNNSHPTNLANTVVKAYNLMNNALTGPMDANPAPVNSNSNNKTIGRWDVAINYLETPLLSDQGYSGEQHQGVSVGTVTINQNHHTELKGISSFISTSHISNSWWDRSPDGHPAKVSYTTNVGNPNPVIEQVCNDIYLNQASLDFDPLQVSAPEVELIPAFEFKDLQEGLSPEEIQQGRVLQSYLKYCDMGYATDIKLEKCNGQSRWALYCNFDANPDIRNPHKTSTLIGYATLESADLNCDTTVDQGLSFTAEGLFKVASGDVSPFGVRFNLDQKFISNNKIDPKRIQAPTEPVEIACDDLEGPITAAQFSFKFTWDNYWDYHDVTRRDLLPAQNHREEGSVSFTAGKLSKALRDKLAGTYGFCSRFSYKEISHFRDEQLLKNPNENQPKNDAIV